MTWAGGENPDPAYVPPRIRSSYTVSLVTKPILRDGETPADDLVEAAIRSLHGWEPDAAKFPCYEMLEVSRVRLLQDEETRRYLIHQFQVQATLQIQPAS